MYALHTCCNWHTCVGVGRLCRLKTLLIYSWKWQWNAICLDEKWKENQPKKFVIFIEVDDTVVHVPSFIHTHTTTLKRDNHRRAGKLSQNRLLPSTKCVPIRFHFTFIFCYFYCASSVCVSFSIYVFGIISDWKRYHRVPHECNWDKIERNDFQCLRKPVHAWWDLVSRRRWRFIVCGYVSLAHSDEFRIFDEFRSLGVGLIHSNTLSGTISYPKLNYCTNRFQNYIRPHPWYGLWSEARTHASTHTIVSRRTCTPCHDRLYSIFRQKILRWLLRCWNYFYHFSTSDPRRIG